MRQITPLYFNDFGMAFYWKKENTVLLDKVQLVFKETGFYFSITELEEFSALIEEACERNSCKNCEMKQQCLKFLLKTPVSQIDLAVSLQELSGIKDLVKGAIFRITLENHINGVGRN